MGTLAEKAYKNKLLQFVLHFFGTLRQIGGAYFS